MGTRRIEALFICIVMGFGLASPVPMWGQTQLFTTWEAGGVVWCGDSSFWCPCRKRGRAHSPTPAGRVTHSVGMPNGRRVCMGALATRFGRVQRQQQHCVLGRSTFGQPRRGVLDFGVLPPSGMARRHGRRGGQPRSSRGPNQRLHSWSDPSLTPTGHGSPADGAWMHENLRSSRWLDTVAEPTLTKRH